MYINIVTHLYNRVEGTNPLEADLSYLVMISVFQCFKSDSLT